MRTSVHINFTPDVRATLIDYKNPLFRWDLDDFRRIRGGEHARTTRRRAHAFRVVLRFVHRMIVVNRSGPGLERHPGLGRSSAALTTAASAATALRSSAGRWS